MKNKIVLIVLLISTLFTFSSCKNSTSNQTLNKNEFSLSRTERINANEVVSIMVDKETGVNYIFFKIGYGGGMSVRYNADGTIYTSK